MSFQDVELLEPPRRRPLAADCWYVHGCSREHQFILCFGTARRPGSFNGRSVRHPRYGVLLWGAIGQEKFVSIEESLKPGFPPASPFTFDRYRSGYVLRHGRTELVFSREFQPAAEGRVLTTRLRSEYREVRGKLEGHGFRGRALLQRARVNGPLASWDRLRFSGRHEGGFFRLPRQERVELLLDGQAYGVSLRAFDGHHFLFSDEVRLRATPYARHHILLRGLGKLHCAQYLVRVEGKVGGKTIKALGTSELARGFVI